MGFAMLFTVKKESIIEFREKKSVFIGQAFYAPTAKDALSVIASVRQKNPEASHVCWAYSTMFGSERKASDDGEPSGTAGIPILKVIEMKNVVDTVVTVTRYFGGILLGARGLVRAYLRAASDALEAAEKTDITEYDKVRITFPFELQGGIERLLEDEKIEVLARDYAEAVQIFIDLPADKLALIKTAVNSRWYGKVSYELILAEHKRRL